MAKKTYTMNDQVIAEIAKNLQRALLTGTDIVDNLRQMTLCVNRVDDTVSLSQSYVRAMENNDNKMVIEAQALSERVESEVLTLNVTNKPIFQ